MGAATLDGLIAHARSLGLTVEERPFTGALRNLNAVLIPGGYVILNCYRTEITRRCSLAHEMGHWYYGHDWRREHDKAHDERQADTYAAKLLISPAEYAAAEALHGSHVGALAAELAVPSRIVTLWQQTEGRKVSIAGKRRTLARVA